MLKKPLFFVRSEYADVFKSHVAAYTRKDGTVVAEHDDSRVSSDAAFDAISAAGGSTARTSSSGIGYYHGEKRKTLAHRDEADGTRTVSKRELDEHLSALRGSSGHETAKDGTLPGWKKTGVNHAK
jgi:hypothetical protein